MTEQQLEILDKYFPSGYVILYLDPKDRVRMSKWLPTKSKGCAELEANYRQIAERKDDEDANNVYTP